MIKIKRAYKTGSFVAAKIVDFCRFMSHPVKAMDLEFLLIEFGLGEYPKQRLI